MATRRDADKETRKSGFTYDRDAAETQRLSRPSPGQSYPRHCPKPDDNRNVLGEPLTIRDVATLIGCCAWTVRQQYLPQGMPHLRSGPQGKLVFFRDQVIRWILERQQKGGK